MLRQPDARATLVALATLLLVAALPVGCSAPPAEPSAGGFSAPLSVPGVRVGVDWLGDHRDDPRLLVIDARSAEEYAAGHVPGAVHLEPSELLDSDPANAKNVAPVKAIESTLSQVGIDMTRTVVVYDGSSYRRAARVFWVLEVHGLTEVAVLDGGFAAWRASQGAIERRPVLPEARSFVASLQPRRYATKLTVSRALDDPSIVILDSRTQKEYDGLTSKARRAGHIKSALNVDVKSNLTEGSESCMMRSVDELTQLYESALPAGTERVITYCNSGNRASVSYLALRAVGRDAAVYDGSWLEWGNDEELPIGPEEEHPS